jgi:hypothetical protein
MTFAQLAVDIRRRPRRPGQRTLIVAVDGMSGAGKSGFAARLATELGAQLVCSDDLVPGWDGLEASIGLIVEWVLRPAASGQPVRWRRYDWVSDRPGEWTDTPVGDALVIEGCGVGAPATSEYLSYLIWVDTPEAQRRAQLQARDDWPGYQPFLERWTAQERALQARSQAPRRADLIVDNSSWRPGADWGDQFCSSRL